MNMRTIIVSSCLSLVGCLGTFGAGAMATDQSSQELAGNTSAIVRIKIDPNRSKMQLLTKHDYDITGVNLEKNTMDILISHSNDLENLRTLGFEIAEVLSPNLLIELDTRYKTPQRLEEILGNFARNYPNIAKLESIGKSHEGRDIWALKISDNPDVRETDEPAILFNAMHHAREVMTTEVALDAIEFLLARYGIEEKSTNWVNSNEIWVVPMLNPDGNNKVWSTYRYWRKNNRDKHGVDLNRNYPYDWNACNGSSGERWSDTYRGPSAGSEPETQALMGLVSRIEPVFNISYHSYSELVLYPYGCSGKYPASRDVIENVGRQLASYLPRDSGKGTYTPGTPWELLYSADGGDIDWMYHEHNVVPYVIELNSSSQGFQPSYTWRQPTVEKQRAGWGLLLDRLSGSGIRGMISSSQGLLDSNTTISVTPLGKGSSATQIFKSKKDGTYHLILNAGMYRLTFTNEGRSITHDVTIGAKRTDLNIEFE